MELEIRNASIIPIFKHNNTVLLRLKYYDFGWVSPGGGIDKDEQPWIAALREFKEETGMCLELDKITDITSFLSGSAKVFIVRTTQEFTIDMITLSNEHYDGMSVDIRDVPSVHGLAAYAEVAFDHMFRMFEGCRR